MDVKWELKHDWERSAISVYQCVTSSAEIKHAHLWVNIQDFPVVLALEEQAAWIFCDYLIVCAGIMFGHLCSPVVEAEDKVRVNKFIMV